MRLFNFRHRLIADQVLSDLARSWCFAVHVLATRSVVLMA